LITLCLPRSLAIRRSLTDRSVADLVKLYAARLGLEAGKFAAHCLRAGFVTTAADRDVELTRIMDDRG
jgi:site-specific recombinase XerD